MDYKDKLARVAELAGSVHELERDLALELLREIYSEIKFGSTRNSVVGDFSEATALGRGESLMDETVPEGEECHMAEKAVEDKIAEEEVAGMEIVAEVKTELPSIVPRRVAPEVIRSLYGSDAEEEERQKAEEGQKTEQEQATDTEQERNLDPRQKPETEEPEPEEGKYTVSRRTTTLGEAIASGHRTLGETLASGQLDLASKIAAADRPSLRRSIGLNDRFLMIRDMFDGEADAFDRAITRLDAFTDLDEAVIWMRSNFDWNADGKGVALLVGLLERKLGR